MTDTTTRLETLIKNALEYFSQSSDLEISQKSSPEKWSKKEILGHLIDSGINNLQRFTEIQFENKPYRVRNYKQDDLVRANNYQNADFKEMIDFWASANYRILALIKQQTEKTLAYKVELDNENISDLRYLMHDYVDHLEHHLNQIFE